MLLADTRSEPGPLDPFKTVYERQAKKDEVIEKINKVTHYSPTTNAEHDGFGIK